VLLEITHALEVPSAVDIPCEQEVVVLSAVPFDFPPPSQGSSSIYCCSNYTRLASLRFTLPFECVIYAVRI